MALTPVEFPRFGGLDFSTDPQEEGWVGAVDLMDVMFDWPGRVRSRDGIAQTGTVPSTYFPIGMTYWPAQQTVVSLASQSAGYKLVDQAGTTLRTINVGNASQAAWFVNYGTPTNQYLVYTAEGIPQVYADAATTLTTSYGGGPLGVTPWDNRLVIGTGDRVRFSDPGAPTVYGTNNYVDLTPGDGQKITAICQFRDLLLVFKQTKFFVFNGISTDSTGQPIFNYRTVNVGHGARSYNGAVATSDGVFFADSAGLWLTAGETPRKLSAKIDPLFANRATYLGPDATGELPYTSEDLRYAFGYATAYQLAAVNDHVVINTTVPGTTTGPLGPQPGPPCGTIAFHRPSETWTAWTITALCMCGGATGTRDSTIAVTDGVQDMYFTDSVGAAAFTYKMSRSLDADTVPVNAVYQPGFWSPSPASDESDVFEWIADGAWTSLSLAMGVSDIADYATLGSFSVPSGLSQGRVMVASYGRNFSPRISGPQKWSVSRLIANVSSRTQAGFKAA